MEKLFQAGLDVNRSLQPSCFLSGNRKSGKTEILKRVYNRMFWEQNVIVPFFHPFPNFLGSAEVFCREYFFRTVLQFVGFLKKDPMLVMADEFNLDRIIQLAHESQYSWLVEALDNFQVYSHNKDLRAAAKLAIAFPATASMKAGLRAFVILDDFHRISSLPSAEETGVVVANFLLALQSRQAPHLFSGSLKAVMMSLFKTAELPGSMDVLPMRPLKSAEAQLLFERLCERFDVAYEPDLSLLVAQQLGDNPFYLRTLVQAARRESRDFRTVRKLADLYTRELTEGNLQLYFNGLLHSVSLNPLERIKALELLHLCSQKPLDFSIFRYFKTREGGEGYDFEKIMNALDQLTLVDYGLGIVASIQDNVFKDWIEWNFSHKITGIPLHQVSYLVTSEVLNRFNRAFQLRKYTYKLEQIRQSLLGMDCQTVPSLLFDYEQFAGEQESELSPSPAGNLRQAELTLPEIISVNTVGGGPTCALDFSDQILVGRGFAEKRYADNTATAWLVSYCPTEDTVGLEEIERFYQRCQQTIQLEGLRSVKYWLLGEKRFNQAAASFAKKFQIQTSNSTQFDGLFSLLFKQPACSGDPVDPKDLIAYEMIIPMVSDAELVAVRALEQITENGDFDEKSKGQIRMALIEACINAKEAASSQKARIRLRFQTSPDRLITHLHYESSTNNEVIPSREATKGWSVKMLQTLMDDVKLYHSHHGLELVMTKYLRRSKKEAV